MYVVANVVYDVVVVAVTVAGDGDDVTGSVVVISVAAIAHHVVAGVISCACAIDIVISVGC